MKGISLIQKQLAQFQPSNNSGYSKCKDGSKFQGPCQKYLKEVKRNFKQTT